MLFREGFSCGKQGAAEVLLLQVRPHGEKAQIPHGVLSWVGAGIEQDRSEQRALLVLVQKKVRVGLRGEIVP